jgi:hypothetical protein
VAFFDQRLGKAPPARSELDPVNPFLFLFALRPRNRRETRCRRPGYGYVSAVIVLIPISIIPISIAIRHSAVATGPVIALQRACLVVAAALIASLIGLPQRILLALVPVNSPEVSAATLELCFGVQF